MKIRTFQELYEQSKQHAENDYNSNMKPISIPEKILLLFSATDRYRICSSMYANSKNKIAYEGLMNFYNSIKTPSSRSFTNHIENPLHLNEEHKVQLNILLFYILSFLRVQGGLILINVTKTKVEKILQTPKFVSLTFLNNFINNLFEEQYIYSPLEIEDSLYYLAANGVFSSFKCPNIEATVFTLSTLSELYLSGHYNTNKSFSPKKMFIILDDLIKNIDAYSISNINCRNEFGYTFRNQLKILNDLRVKKGRAEITLKNKYSHVYALSTTNYRLPYSNTNTINKTKYENDREYFLYKKLSKDQKVLDFDL